MNQRQELELELREVEALLEEDPDYKMTKNGSHFYAKHYKRKLEQLLGKLPKKLGAKKRVNKAKKYAK